MSVSRGVARRACDRVFAEVSELGGEVPGESPGALFLADAARCVDLARELLAPRRLQVEAALRWLQRARALLGAVAELEGREPERSVGAAGVDRLSVVIEGIEVNLEHELQAEAERGDPDA